MTIQSTPPSYASVHADLLYVVAEPAKTADPVAYPNYKYICDVYVGGVLAARLKRVPDPTYKLGVFNIGAVVRNYMTSLFNPTGALVSQVAGEPNFYLSVLVKFGKSTPTPPTTTGSRTPPGSSTTTTTAVLPTG
jgi:hypothetical protein